MRRVALGLAAMALAMLLASGVALAVNKIGTDGPDTLSGTKKADNLLGKGGKDVLHGLGGGDDLVGGTGNDAVWGDRGSDNLLGAEGNDYLSDGAFTEFSEDNLSSGGGNDVLDAINQPAFGDTIVCGRGFDRVLADRKDVVAPDCEKVAVGLDAVVRLAGSIPRSFFEGLNPAAFE
jgi:Ca2+-binding RTX toxin-like protein